jgi:hypothetical protein
VLTLEFLIKMQDKVVNSVKYVGVDTQHMLHGRVCQLLMLSRVNKTILTLTCYMSQRVDTCTLC